MNAAMVIKFLCLSLHVENELIDYKPVMYTCIYVCIPLLYIRGFECGCLLAQPVQPRFLWLTAPTSTFLFYLYEVSFKGLTVSQHNIPQPGAKEVLFCINYTVACRLFTKKVKFPSLCMNEFHNFYRFNDVCFLCIRTCNNGFVCICLSKHAACDIFH